MISAARRSCAGFTKLEQEHDRDRLARRAASAGGRRGAPRPRRAVRAPRRRKFMRSGIGMRARRRAIGGGAGYVGSQISSLWTRRISISSRCPSVTSRPVGAPFISIIVLSAVVVPWTTMSISAQSSASGRSNRSASCCEAVHDPDGLVVGRRRRLVEHDLAVRRHADEVGERAPDVHSRPGSPSSAPALRPTSGGGLLVDREREVLERAGQHDAVVALGAARRSRTRRARRRARPAAHGRADCPTRRRRRSRT